MRLTLKSWELWHSLYTHPAVNAPLIHQYAKPSPPIRRGLAAWLVRHAPKLSKETQESILLTFILMSIVLFWCNLTQTMRFIAQVVVIGGGLLLLCALILPGMNVALKVSGMVFREQAKGRYDLLALAPRGLAVVYWALIMRCLRDDLIAVRLRQFVHSLGNIFVLPMIAGMIPAMLVALVMIVFDVTFALQILAIIGIPIIIFGILYADHMQSIVIAVLLSMVVPAYIYSRSGIWMAWVAPLMFIGGQILFYLAYFVFLNYLNTFIIGLDGAGFTLTVCKEAFIAFGVLVSLREVMIRGLWRLALSQFSEDLRELQLD